MKDRALQCIRNDGPMPFDAFMELSLYDPDSGFFSAGEVRPGTDADFVTSPEVSPWFGRLIGRWVAEKCRVERGGPGTMTLVEVGGGSGSLLRPLVEEAGGALDAIVAVEVSEAARRSIAHRVPNTHVVRSLDEASIGRNAVVVANEVLDNLPTRLVQRTSDGWLELCVGEADDDLAMVAVRADADLAAWCDSRLVAVPEGRVLAAQTHFERWFRELLSRFETVAILIIDYAARTSDLAMRRRKDVVRSFVSQRSGHDVLVEPGSTDITVDVNTDVVVAIADELGLEVSVTPQRQFLLEQDAQGVLDELVQRSHELASAGDVMGQLVAKSEAIGLRALLDPSGLGGFTVFRLSTREPGVPVERLIGDETRGPV